MMRFPWARAMELGLGQLRLAPRDFWAMTLPELSAAAAALNTKSLETMTRGRLNSLAATFPDSQPKGNSNACN
jgi:uncharacterized phage protein (TIGR02216 family)